MGDETLDSSHFTLYLVQVGVPKIRPQGLGFVLQHLTHHHTNVFI